MGSFESFKRAPCVLVLFALVACDPQLPRPVFELPLSPGGKKKPRTAVLQEGYVEFRQRVAIEGNCDEARAWYKAALEKAELTLDPRYPPAFGERYVNKNIDQLSKPVVKAAVGVEVKVLPRPNCRVEALWTRPL